MTLFQKQCEHQLDKNHKYCIKCGCPVVSEILRKATPKEQKEWLENPEEFLKKRKQNI
jgi:hypothetical protein